MSNRKSAIGAKQMNVRRKLFLIDIENIVGKPIINENDVALVKRWVLNNLGLSETDMVVVGASSSQNSLAAMTAWRGVRHVFKKGHDGADLALIASAHDYKTDQFDEVVIMSGDGVFASLADHISSLGTIVTVVSACSSLSKKLVNPLFKLHMFSRQDLDAA